MRHLPTVRQLLKQEQKKKLCRFFLIKQIKLLRSLRLAKDLVFTCQAYEFKLGLSPFTEPPIIPDVSYSSFLQFHRKHICRPFFFSTPML